MTGKRCPALTPAEIRADLAWLRDVWSTRERSFGHRQRAAFARVVAAAMKRAGALSFAAFSLETSRAVACARNGHTRVVLGPGFHGLPFKAAWFQEGLFIVRTHPRFARMLGARIEAFGALSARQALQQVAPFISGTDAWIRHVSPGWLRLLEVLHYIGASRSPNTVSMTLRLRDQRREQVLLTREPNTDPEAIDSWLAVIPGNRAVRGRWAHVLDNRPALPLYCQPVTPLSWVWLSKEPWTLYIRSNHSVSPRRQPYRMHAQLLDLLTYEIAPRRPRSVIFDLRLNAGGNLFNTALFSQALPQLLSPGGRIFVLIGPGTFSAALVTAALLKGHGGERVVLIGGPLGDNPAFWAEGEPACLPISGLRILGARLKHDWSRKPTDPQVYFWPNIVFGSPQICLDPQIRIATRFADYVAGRDPVLEHALALTPLPRSGL